MKYYLRISKAVFTEIPAELPVKPVQEMKTAAGTVEIPATALIPEDKNPSVPEHISSGDSGSFSSGRSKQLRLFRLKNSPADNFPAGGCAGQQPVKYSRLSCGQLRYDLRDRGHGRDI